MTTPIAIVYPSQFADFKKHAKAFANMLASYSEEKPLSGFKAPDELAKAIKYKSHDDLLRVGKQRALADKQEPLNLFEPDSMTRTSIIDHFVGIGYIEEIVTESVKNLSVSIAVRNVVGADGLETIMKGIEAVTGDFEKITSDMTDQLQEAEANNDLTTEAVTSFVRMVLSSSDGFNELHVRGCRIKNKPVPTLVGFDVTNLNLEQRYHLAKWKNSGLSINLRDVNAHQKGSLLCFNGKEGLYSVTGLESEPPAGEGTLKITCDQLLSPFALGLKRDLVNKLPNQNIDMQSRTVLD